MCSDFILSGGPPASVNECKNCVSSLVKGPYFIYLCIFLSPSTYLVALGSSVSIAVIYRHT